MTDDVRPEEARRLARLAVISVFAAISWMVGVGPVATGVITWAPALAFGLVAVLAMAIAVVRTISANQEVMRRVVTQLRKPTSAAHHIGCRVGRRRLEVGLLHVTEQTIGLPLTLQIGPVDETEHVVFKEKADNQERFDHHDMYEKLGDALYEQIDRADRQHIKVASIGVAVPGGVAPNSGHFDGAVQGVPFLAGEHVSQIIADDLLKKCGRDMIKRVFQTADRESLMEVIHLDNDARSAARWLITARGVDWTDFVCVFAGTGLGSGLVFDRHIFYGATFRAGEVGHVNLNAGDQLVLGGKTLKPRLCSCGQEGYHFESMAGIGGLGHIAEALDAVKLAAVERKFLRDPARAATVTGLEPHEKAGMVLLRVLHGVHDPALRAIAADPDLRPYLKRLMQLYGQLFGVGITAILDALDLPHVVLCGTIPEFLQGNPDFVFSFKGYLGSHVIGRVADSEFGNMRQWGWRGAALLPRDPDYVKRRYPT
ncbi:ROK family protein [Streptomyces sp. S.PB5]|uniref:ROK family protein n=1 Tax=Streptomyces sp. S.PB5 TaxID=3020844 RepID=UPI0025AFF01F|nr:ROK family protein [Streptomyces sp. S.PB5]MDN3027523.1 ROK family protein [Streptomyces sp. S.PB5]